MSFQFSSLFNGLMHATGLKKRIKLFTETEESEIVAAIVKAENRTSAEIRVHISHLYQPTDAVNAATKTFKKLGMHKTADRNGILIYLAPYTKQFAILGDEGINNKVAPGQWDQMRDAMQNHFQQQQFKTGVLLGIEESATLLSQYFAPGDINPNELSNEISNGN
jgi:uncharacterized membrane protein